MVIAIAAQKGGSAKTTTTIHLGAALAQLGRRVLLVDMDPQGHLGEGLGIPRGLPHDMTDVLERKVPLRVVIRCVHDSLFLAPSTIRMSALEMLLINQPRREDRLRTQLAPVRAQYDYVLLDCPPSLGILTVNALCAADRVLVPMAADYYGFLGAQLLLEALAGIREEINPALTLLGLFYTRVRRTTNARETMAHMGTWARRLDAHIFEAQIPETVQFQEASSLGVTIFDHAPDGAGASAYRALALEVDNANEEKPARLAPGTLSQPLPAEHAR